MEELEKFISFMKYKEAECSFDFIKRFNELYEEYLDGEMQDLRDKVDDL